MRSKGWEWVYLALALAACGGSDRAAQAGSGSNAGTGNVSSSAGAAEGDTSDADASSAGAICEEHVLAATRATPDMLVVLDRSGSMNPDKNDTGTDRWRGSRDAVVQVTASFDDRIRFGLMTFPAFAGTGIDTQGQCAAGTLNVPIALDDGDAIASALAAMNASGRTPTAATLTAALPVIAGMGVDPDDVTPKYVLLVTDGDPNCSGASTMGGNQPDPLARQQTIAAIEALTKAGVKTYVVGYQTLGSGFEAQLDAMAAAGGTGETMHRSVASGDELTATFSQIAAGVVSCSYALDAPVKDASYVLVTVDGVPRALGNASDGWTLGADMQTVTLTGAACEAVKAGAELHVQVQCTVVEVK